MQDNFITEYIVPVRVIATGGNVYAAETLLNEKPLQIGLSEGELCAVQGVGFIVLDFGTADEKMYHCGASSKDAGDRMTAITEFRDTAMKNAFRSIIQSMINNRELRLR